MADRATSDNVGTPTDTFLAMDELWQKIRDLQGGTEAMREAGTTYLPQHEKETAAQYDARLRISYLFGGFSDTVDSLSSRPFRKPIMFSGDFPEKTKGIIDDADMEGSTLTHFAAEVFADAVAMGKSHVLVDGPSIEGDISLAEERQLGVRSYLVHIKANQLIGWRYEKIEGGARRLVQIRIREYVEEPDGAYGAKIVEKIRVINAPGGGEKGTWEVHTRDVNTAETARGFDYGGSRSSNATQEWVLESFGTHSFKEIPLFTVYTNRTGPMTAEPPMMDMAELNIAHWQSTSSQRNILQFARIGLLFGAGFEEEELQAIVIAPNRIIGTTNSEAQLRYVEYTGNAIDAGFQDLETLEARMERLGMKPLQKNTNFLTATGVVVGESKNSSSIQAWIQAAELVFTQALALAAEQDGEKVPSDFSVDIYSDFAIEVSTNEDIKTLQVSRAAGDISQETILEEMKRRGVLSPALDVEKEIAETEAEFPDLSMSQGFDQTLPGQQNGDGQPANSPPQGNNQ